MALNIDRKKYLNVNFHAKHSMLVGTFVYQRRSVRFAINVSFTRAPSKHISFEIMGTSVNTRVKCVAPSLFTSGIIVDT